MRDGPEPADGVVRRAIDIGRAGGPGALLYGVLGATVYRRLVIFEQGLDGLPASGPLGIELAFGGAERLADYETLRPGQRAMAERRLAEGQRWAGTWEDGRLVSARWIAPGRPPIDYLGMRLPLAADEVYIHDIYTAPDRRRHGIAGAGSRLLYPMLAAEGLSRVVGTCLPENRTGWLSVVSAGFRPCGKIGYVRLGPWRREFCRREPR